VRFPGHAYGAQFFMADYRDCTGWGSEARLYFGAHGSVESFPLPDGCRRWVVQMPNRACPEAFNLGRTVSDQVHARTGVDLHGDPILFASWFRPHRRLADTYRSGRILLCGDAAHVMSPIGGQGMNTGFADAAHLAEALAEVIKHPETADRVFAHYTRSRRRAFRTAADRAARGMWLGTRRGYAASAFRQLLIAYMLFRPAIRERLAHCFAMLTITENDKRHMPRKVPAQ
jgi:2-polyprenyl-6-methoxyphenol hydroxylase-like FAD-dependent oxidoreductase